MNWYKTNISVLITEGTEFKHGPFEFDGRIDDFRLVDLKVMDFAQRGRWQVRLKKVVHHSKCNN